MSLWTKTKFLHFFFCVQRALGRAQVWRPTPSNGNHRWVNKAHCTAPWQGTSSQYQNSYLDLAVWYCICQLNKNISKYWDGNAIYCSMVIVNPESLALFVWCNMSTASKFLHHEKLNRTKLYDEYFKLWILSFFSPRIWRSLEGKGRWRKGESTHKMFRQLIIIVINWL